VTGDNSCFDASAGTCVYNGMTYAIGASFPSTDGCNQCTCTASGVACTERACLDAAPLCTSNADCASGAECAYLIADTCSATGSCQPTHVSPACDAIPICACDGTQTAVACNLPTGYASKPVTGDQACLRLDATAGGD
jgi:hypothetical protein